MMPTTLQPSPATGAANAGTNHNFLSSLRIYWILVLILAVLSGVSMFLPQGSALPAASGQAMPLPLALMALAVAGVIFLVYGLLGTLGLFLSGKLGFAAILDPRVTNRQRYLTPAILGAVLGVFFIVTDLLITPLHNLGPLPHPPFPTSIIASITAGIGEETLFRLFFVSLWTWLVSSVILRGRWQTPVFWVVTTFSAVAFTAGHLPSLVALMGLTDFSQLKQVPVPIFVEMLLLNGLLSFVAADQLRKHGFLAAAGVHFWADIVWHVVWGLIGSLL